MKDIHTSYICKYYIDIVLKYRGLRKDMRYIGWSYNRIIIICVQCVFSYIFDG